VPGDSGRTPPDGGSAPTPPGRTPLGPGREFDLIRRWISGPELVSPGVVLGPGDDAAVLEGGWVVSCDMSVDGVHFNRGWLMPDEIGGRALRGALSDLAAMAAEPIGVLVAIAGSSQDYEDTSLEAVGRGVREAAAAFGTPVIGGDVARSLGPLVIDVTVLGRTPAPVLRSGARPGDDLWVTGSLGAASAAVHLWKDHRFPSPALIERFARPVPRIAAARHLAASGHLHALIDISDGLSGDASHLAMASAVRLEIDVDRVPLHPALVQACRRHGPLGEPPQTALEIALSGGEDYELLFAADPAFRRDVDAARTHCGGLEFTRIGRVVAAAASAAAGAGPGVVFERDGEPWSPPHSFDHFLGDRP
jgi:thiamine-monophosphate kinase